MKIKNIHVVIALGLVLIAGVIYATTGNQYNWGTSTGASWITPDDTTVRAGTVLQIGSSGGAVVVAAATPLTLFQGSSTTITALTPSTTGQLVFLLNGALNNVLCISTGIATNQWALVGSTNTSCR